MNNPIVTVGDIAGVYINDYARLDEIKKMVVFDFRQVKNEEYQEENNETNSSKNTKPGNGKRHDNCEKSISKNILRNHKKTESKNIFRNKSKSIKNNKSRKENDRQIVSCLYVVMELRKMLPDCMVFPISDQECIVEWITSQKVRGKGIRVFLVCVLCLAGGAFSVMAFHNDIGISEMFGDFSDVIAGNQEASLLVLEGAYSIGLMAGVILFYNHLGKFKITKDPTPIEVSMRTYEQDMNQAMIQTWDREGKTIDI